MTREQAAAAIAQAMDAMLDAYWAACDAEGKAIEPDDLDAPDGLLDDAYDAALQVEAISQARDIDWVEARQFV